MTQNPSEHIKRSDSLWIGLIVTLFLSIIIPYFMWFIIKQNEWSGIIVLTPMMILYILLIRGLKNLKEIKIAPDQIEVCNYWTKKTCYKLNPKSFSKLIYYVPIRSIPPYGPINITVIVHDDKYQFSIKGFYEEDFLKLFEQHSFPIYEQFSDKTRKMIKGKATNRTSQTMRD